MGAAIHVTRIGEIEDNTARFFAYARERHAVHLRRVAEIPRPWTEDSVLASYKFVNVFRELDATTRWFARNVRGPMRDELEVLLATVVFRWFTRVEVGEALFLQRDMFDGRSAFEEFVATGSTDPMRRAVVAMCGRGPYVTGAYFVTSPKGMTKLDGMLWCVKNFNETEQTGFGYSTWESHPRHWRDVAHLLASNNEIPLHATWNWLRRFPFQGPFHAYEVVTDLRHTALHASASDVDRWANPGPGAVRGLNRIHGRDVGAPLRKEQAVEEMAELLAASRRPKFWPQTAPPRRHEEAQRVRTYGYTLLESCLTLGEWPRWEMREVEHTLCEFDKYERTRTGQGTPRSRYP